MASDLATKRLRKELIALKKNPVQNIVATPLESNILEWHYCIQGTDGTDYAGGHYHGKLKFPPQYPLKPPSVLMFTPNGRFKTNRRLCLSMSDFHPETWNPMWQVSSILTGLYSFMLDNAATLGSMEATSAQRKNYASQSLEYNCKDPIFVKLFPELVELHEERQKLKAEEAAKNPVATEGGKEREQAEAGKADVDAPSPMFFIIVAAVAVALLAVLLQL